MSKRNLFEELSTALVEAKQHSEGKLTLRTHVVQRTGVPEIKPQEILWKKSTASVKNTPNG
jgi:putative transcriptional regulator